MVVVDLKALGHGNSILDPVEHLWIGPMIMSVGWVLSIVFMPNARRVKPRIRNRGGVGTQPEEE
ncbi:MAG: hypothetical protein ACU84Q_13235 [Gammaproteobacteria bacterium]